MTMADDEMVAGPSTIKRYSAHVNDGICSTRFAQPGCKVVAVVKVLGRVLTAVRKATQIALRFTGPVLPTQAIRARRPIAPPPQHVFAVLSVLARYWEASAGLDVAVSPKPTVVANHRTVTATNDMVFGVDIRSEAGALARNEVTVMQLTFANVGVGAVLGVRGNSDTGLDPCGFVHDCGRADCRVFADVRSVEAYGVTGLHAGRCRLCPGGQPHDCPLDDFTGR